MDPSSIVRGRGRGTALHEPPRQLQSRNRQWVAGEAGAHQQHRSRSGTPSTRPHHHPIAATDNERWERGGGHGRARGTRGPSRGFPRGGPGPGGKFPNVSLRVTSTLPTFASPSSSPPTHSSHEFEDPGLDMDFEEPVLYDREGEGDEEVGEEEIVHQEAVAGAETDGFPDPEEPILESPEAREKFYQSLVKSRELERKAAIASGKMDDPSIPKRLEDAISVVGTCLDMCPRFERYRRERENNLFEWETIPGTKRVDHKRAVKMYERAAGDKTLPSDLRPPHVLKRTLDYLFHDLLSRGGFSATFNFIRDRSRAVRNDFTMQHSYGSVAIECHDRCARFHILALHFERERQSFSVALEEQQLMNTLQSLKEFYEDQRGRYESPTELEMRVYHRLIHIRDQRERHETVPEHITSHPVFKLTTDFRIHVQRKSAPISKTSPLVVDTEGMQIFGNLANVLREQGNVVMIYLVACILERLFGKDAIDDIEAIRGDLGIPAIIDGVSSVQEDRAHDYEEKMQDDSEVNLIEDELRSDPTPTHSPNPTNNTKTLFSSFPGSSTTVPQVPKITPAKPTVSAFSSLSTTPNVFSTPSPFGTSTFPSSSTPILGVPAKSVFGTPISAAAQPVAASMTALPRTSVFGRPSTTLGFPSTTSEPSSVVIPTMSTESSSVPAPPSDLQPNDLNFAPITTVTHQTLPSKPEPTNPLPQSIPEKHGILGRKPLFSSVDGSGIPALNPMAPPFVLPTSEPIRPSLNPFNRTPATEPFQRSSNPSPSPIPSAFKVPGPSTPAPPPVASSSSFTSSTTKPSPPPSQRHSTTPPVLPKINTNTSSSSFQTPTVPPPLAKHQPISLPLTPSIGIPPINPLLNFRKASLATPISTTSQEILSPLLMSSPEASEHSLLYGLSPAGKSPRKGSVDQPSLLFTNGQGKARASQKPVAPIVNEEDLDRRSSHFNQRSVLVKSCFRRWRQRIEDRAAWIEACRQSDAYKLRIKQRQRQRSYSTSPAHLVKKRRASSDGRGATIELPLKKRARRRISSEYRQPLTDEDLARRFKENHKEHERRWAQGSFLEVIKNHVKPKLHDATLQASWRLWLSTNPYSDATAIWLERKLDVPASGDWVAEVAFSMPLTRSPDSTVPSSPGLVLFECTPLEGVPDDLERKYRILDDCARLRDLIGAFSSNRYFIPSILLISWAEKNESQTASDFTDMVKKLVETHSISGYHTLSITSKEHDLDGRLSDALNALPLDVEGSLVKSLNIRGLFKLFESEFMSFITEWIENCTINGQFEWQIFGQIIEVAVTVMNTTAHSISELISEETDDIFPAFECHRSTDNDSVYQHVINWLSAIGGSAETLAVNIQTHRSIGQEFPARELFEQLWFFSQLQMELQLRQDPQATYHVPVSTISAVREKQQAAYAAHKIQLGRVLQMSVRRSPKRRSTSADTDLTSSYKKKRRFSSPLESRPDDDTPFTSPFLNGRLTPSPTPTNVSLATSEGPAMVTVAMLRALTRDVKKKYAGS